jgi:uncharacterized protein YqgV (UPF0045/DUF77 family)
MLIDLQTTELGRLRAIFRFSGPREVLVELSVNPVGNRISTSQELSQLLEVSLDPKSPRSSDISESSTDADWEEVMMYVRRCHEAMRSGSSEVITTVRIQETTGGAQQASISADLLGSWNRQEKSEAEIVGVAATQSH